MKKSTPMVFLALGAIFVALGSILSSRSEGNAGLWVLICGTAILLLSLVMFIKYRSTSSKK